MPTFSVDQNQFLYDGKRVTVLSGAIHYFRVVPEYWEDRLLKLKACGLNTVETYVPWNMHEPKQGKFCFEGMCDLVRFIETAGELGLFVIVRPSPYICAEWEFGGLPSWLLADPNMKLRCYYQPFLDRVDAYYDVLLPKLQPLLCTNGGPIIAMQVENEYGSYGNDTQYLEYLKEGMEQRGINVLLFTSDGPEDFMLQGGMIPGVLATVNFGSKPEAAFRKLQQYQSDKPLMCMEFWHGWFDHWGEEHHTRAGDEVAQVFDGMLRLHASVNVYMFHGGTNFGFYNGANYSDKYEPTVTSYDYDGLLNEAGDPTAKFFAVRDVISKHIGLNPEPLPEPIPKRGYGQVDLKERSGLFEALDRLSTPVQMTTPPTMEQLGQDYGFILYTTHVSGPRKSSELILQEVHDRALVFVNDRFAGVLERWEEQKLVIDIPEEGARLSLLVENMGRVNYGPRLRDEKGITEGVRLGNQFLFGWTIHPLPLDSVANLDYTNEVNGNGPAFFRGFFDVAEPADTFVDMQGWEKGVVYINGFNLGRYWDRGPQKTLYLPAPLLRDGTNEIVIFELHQPKQRAVCLRDSPIVG